MADDKRERKREEGTDAHGGGSGFGAREDTGGGGTAAGDEPEEMSDRETGKVVRKGGEASQTGHTPKRK